MQNTEVLTNLKDILQGWRDCAEELYHDENNLTNEDSHQSLTLPILELKIEKAIRKSLKNRVAGIDNLSAELLRTDNQQMTKIVCQLCNNILENGAWLTNWLSTMFVQVPKYSGIIECAEQPTIALISHISKVLLCILLSKITKTAEEQIVEEQMGFKNKIRTRDQIFNIQMIMEKRRKFNIPLYMAVRNFKKAVGLVRHTAL